MLVTTYHVSWLCCQTEPQKTGPGIDQVTKIKHMGQISSTGGDLAWELCFGPWPSILPGSRRDWMWGAQREIWRGRSQVQWEIREARAWEWLAEKPQNNNISVTQQQLWSPSPRGICSSAQNTLRDSLSGFIENLRSPEGAFNSFHYLAWKPMESSEKGIKKGYKKDRPCA